MSEKKILSYNVNGIRAATRKGLFDYMGEAQPDIVCFQELKARPEDVPQEVLQPEGYFSYWHPAVKKGYSGVGILTREEPKHVEVGCGMDHIDCEGRIIRADFDDYSVMSVYIPSGSSGDERQGFKEKFLGEFHDYVRDLLQRVPKLVISGDFNICHKEIDIHNPKGLANASGFLPHEREWVSQFLELGFEDSFRQVNEDPDNYTWWSFRAASRQRNKGWRIDYHMVSNDLAGSTRSHEIHHHAVHSDHAPIELRLDV